MGIVEVEQNRLRQKEIEVRALVALAAYGTPLQNSEACQKLREIAYPEMLAEKINQETLWFVNVANSAYLKAVYTKLQTVEQIFVGIVGMQYYTRLSNGQKKRI